MFVYGQDLGVEGWRIWRRFAKVRLVRVKER